jgi:hypothetical protein
MSSTPTFSTQLVGQTEKALNAILGRLLAGSDVTEPQWVTLSVAIAGGGPAERDQLADRLAGATKVPLEEARARISELAAAGLLRIDGDSIAVTGAGHELFARIRAAVGEITARLWGSLPAEDLEAAGRVLSTVLARADEELARA